MSQGCRSPHVLSPLEETDKGAVWQQSNRLLLCHREEGEGRGTRLIATEHLEALQTQGRGDSQIYKPTQTPTGTHTTTTTVQMQTSLHIGISIYPYKPAHMQKSIHKHMRTHTQKHIRMFT